MKTGKMNRIKQFIILLVSWLLQVTCQSQALPGSLPGFPFLHNYTTREYRAHAQNFAAVRDSSGMMYFGNFAGILQFDGSNWRLIETGQGTRVMALGIDSTGILYAGARGELGNLATDKDGNMYFNSLLPADFGEGRFREIREIWCTSEGVWFISDKLLFLYHHDTLEIIDPGMDILSGYHEGGNLYIQLRGKGLTRYTHGLFQEIPGGKEFGEAIEIMAILPHSDDRLLIATGTQGLYALDESKGVVDIYTESDPFFHKNLITDAVRLANGNYAFGTSREGIIITDRDGKMIQVINREAGLVNDYVNALCTTPGMLWVALNSGIAVMEIPGPFTLFDERKGLSGGVSGIIRHKEKLVVSTYEGIFTLDPVKNYFIPVRGIITAGWSLLQGGSDLLAATSQGLFRVAAPESVLLNEGFCMALAPASGTPGQFWLGKNDGLYRLTHSGSQWETSLFQSLNEEIRWMMNDGSGRLWGITLSGRILRMDENRGFVLLDTTNGLPMNGGHVLNLFSGNAVAASPAGLFEWNKTSGRFQRLRLPVISDTSQNPWYSTITPDHSGNLWITGGDDKDLAFYVRSDSGYQRIAEPFLPIASIPVQAILPESDSITWFGGPDGLIRYDASVTIDTRTIPPTLIRRITTGSDSLLFGGNISRKKSGDGIPVVTLPYAENTLFFEFACPFFNTRGEVLFSYILEGFEETWSEWTLQDHKEYTNLPAGRYTFRVKARNVYQHVSKEAVFRFVIKAPWYFKWYAYLFYILIGGVLIWLILIIRNRQLVKEKQQLEKAISDRTAEVVKQKEEIEKQSAELTFKNEELEKINRVVKAINSEIHFQNLLQSLLEKTRMIRAVENSTALVYDREHDNFRFTASFGWDIRPLEQVRLTLSQAEQRYLQGSEEIYEDIFLKRDFSSFTGIPELDNLDIPRSMLVLVIRVDNRVEAFMILENMTRDEAFTSQDLSFIRNSKEHIISAFIKTRILADLQSTLNNLKETQDQLIQSEKLASLGQLTAGIAHEIQNPLNFVNNFSALSVELADELKGYAEEARELIKPETAENIFEVVEMIRSNVQKINEHGKRAASIVKGMLQHSRGRSGEFELTDINNLVTEYVNLAYHGMRAKDKSFNTALRTQPDPAAGKAMVVPQDLSRVILNIVNNACYAVDEKAKKGIPGYAPEVVTTTRRIGDRIEIRIRDNGTGMPKEVIEKIFNPFFTTKPTGKGTGLGLSMSFDIITQIHKGKLEVQSGEGEFTEFIINIPEKP